MATSGNIFSGNDEVSGKVKDILCQPCKKKDKQTNAEKYCDTCDEFQCMDCSQGHYTYAFMKGHKLVNANEAEKVFNMKGLDKCNQHQKIIKFFCEDDDQLCCSSCAIIDHRKCNSVVDIQKLAGKTTSKSSTLKIKLQEIKQKAEIIISNVEWSKEKLDEDIKAIPVKIKHVRDEVNKMFDEMEVSVVKETESRQREIMERLIKKQTQTKKYLSGINACLETVDNVHLHGTSGQKFIVEQNMQKQVMHFQVNIDAECHSLETVTVTFDFDETLNLSPPPRKDFVPGQLSFKSRLSEAARAISLDIPKMKLTPVISVDLKKSKDDEEPLLYSGIDFFPDGRLVAVDNFNKKCLVYDENLEKVGSYQLSYYPRSVVVVSDQEVAITSVCKLDILRVSQSNQVTVDRTLKVEGDYNSICLKDKEHFVVRTNDDLKHVRILSFTGELKDFNITFENKTYSYDTSACTYIRDAEKVVLTDRIRDSVYIYDTKTDTRVAVKDDQIKEPRDVSVGPSDTILVCCEGTKSIVHISQTGLILSSYQIDMSYLRSVCVSYDKLFIVVSNGNQLQKLKISF